MLDLLDRLLEHDAWTTGRVLDLSEGLAVEQIDRDFDIGHRTVRETLLHMAGNLEVWTDLMAAQPVRQPAPGKLSIADLRVRFNAAYQEFARLARELRDSGRLNDLYVDNLDQPPQEKSYGGTILHVLTHNHLHRGEVLHVLERLGAPELIEGDVLSWEAARRLR